MTSVNRNHTYVHLSDWTFPTSSVIAKMINVDAGLICRLFRFVVALPTYIAVRFISVYSLVLVYRDVVIHKS